ncbi:MAG: hypothetical protein ABI310_01435, partial [Microbacteriaceae bacterium]
MRLGRAWWAGVLAVAIVVASGSAAVATDPVDIGSNHIVDRSGVLGGKTGDVEKAIDSLYSATGVDLFVVYVDTFTNPTSAQD